MRTLLGLTMVASLALGCGTADDDGAFGGGANGFESSGAGAAEPAGVPDSEEPTQGDLLVCGDPAAAIPLATERLRGYASAQYARAALANQQWPDAASLATEDFEGFYLDQRPLSAPALSARLYETQPDSYTLESRVRLPSRDDLVRPRLVVLVDVSGSSLSTLAVRDEALRGVAAAVDAGSAPSLSVITFGEKATKVLDAVPPASPAVEELLPNLHPELGSSLLDALALATIDPEAPDGNQTATPTSVLILTDGAFVPDTQLITAVSEASARGASVSIAQLGAPGGSDASGASVVLRAGTLVGIASAGRGATLFFNDPLEAQSFFTTRYDELFALSPAMTLNVVVPTLLLTDAPAVGNVLPASALSPSATFGAQLTVRPNLDCTTGLDAIPADSVVHLKLDRSGGTEAEAEADLAWGSLLPGSASGDLLEQAVWGTVVALRTKNDDLLAKTIQKVNVLIATPSCEAGSDCAIALQLADLLRDACSVSGSPSPECASL